MTQTQTDRYIQRVKGMSINQAYWQFGANNSMVVCFSVCVCVRIACVFVCVLGRGRGCYGDDSTSGGSWPVPVWLSTAGSDVTCLFSSPPDRKWTREGHLPVVWLSGWLQINLLSVAAHDMINITWGFFSGFEIAEAQVRRAHQQSKDVVWRSNCLCLLLRATRG